MARTENNSFARSHFPKQLSGIERKREESLRRPLSAQEIASLLSLRFDGEPRYKAIDEFYTQEYKCALEKGIKGEALDKIERYRIATAKEANLLYNDLHSREKKVEYSGSAQD